MNNTNKKLDSFSSIVKIVSCSDNGKKGCENCTIDCVCKRNKSAKITENTNDLIRVLKDKDKSSFINNDTPIINFDAYENEIKNQIGVEDIGSCDGLYIKEQKGIKTFTFVEFKLNVGQNLTPDREKVLERSGLFDKIFCSIDLLQSDKDYGNEAQCENISVYIVVSQYDLFARNCENKTKTTPKEMNDVAQHKQRAVISSYIIEKAGLDYFIKRNFNRLRSVEIFDVKDYIKWINKNKGV